MSTGLENALLLCDILSVLDRANPKSLLKAFEQECLGLTGPVLITEDGSRQPLFNVFAWENRNIQLLLSISPEMMPCNETSSGNCSTYVFIKTFRQKRALTFTRAEIKHLDQLRNLSNSNLNPFIGISFNQGRELMVVWTYCPRSSLDYIIFEKERRFGRTFQCSFLKHILKGLEYIHGSSIKFHGSLFLSNCVVDANWVVKLTDFGLQEIIWDKMLHKELSCFQGVDVERLPLTFVIEYLQLPPEMLRNVLAEGLLGSGSAKADVYQLGMIVYQILFHARPYADKSGLTTKELASIICDRFGDRTDQPFYPTVAEQHEYTTRLLSVMQQCWAKEVEIRPELYVISDAVAREFESE
ncbi:unnamed protein product [Haemonchus placei]|uniref:guanylate cyclase n=1 Tax=Haemonchus placei TaxID=6290 RepID=A0A158QNL7_HAEPC|nr:unnamed protein product [Haemonchus placei]